MTALKMLGVAAFLALAAPSVILAQDQPPAASNSTQPGMADPSMTPSSADQRKALASGDNTLVTNGPVPDTAANRAKYGGPMSRTGKKTAPKGN